MTARQQLARLLPLALLVVLAMAGLRGAVHAPRWNGPLRGDGVAIGLGVEVVFGVLLVITLRREAAARRAGRGRPYSEADDEITPPAALRFVLRWVLGAGMAAIAAVLIANLHLHFFIKPRPPVRPPPPPSHPRHLAPGGRGGPPLHIPIGPILYSLLVLALVAAVVISIWWSARLRRPAAPGRIAGDVDAEDLREAVESGLAALAELDDARAAIIACYLAMERSLADRGAARGAADTPDELLARAVAAGVVRGAASRRLTALFYEARFSSHPLGGEQRDAARQALDELAAELFSREAARS
ncbi:MAG TPA: DUF4129 domain-containing protein [Trebonia sp.]|nr:DUF4129 domain-containing protein [Trebonia sp.]